METGPTGRPLRRIPSRTTCRRSPAGTAATVISDATTQLKQFPPPPHALVKVTNKGKAAYPEHAQCPGISSVAIDVKDRRYDQRSAARILARTGGTNLALLEA